MPFTLEKVYRSDGKDLRTSALTGTEGGFTESAFDGRYLWVTRPVGNQVTGLIDVYEYFGERTDHEPAADTLNALSYGRYESGPYRKLRVVARFNVTTTTSAVSTSVRSLCEFPQYFDSAVGTYTEGTATVTVAMSTLYVGVENSEKVVTVSRPRSGTSLSNLNPFHIQYFNGRMYVTAGLTDWRSVFAFDTNLMRFVEEIKVTDGLPAITTEFSYPTAINTVLASESISVGRVITARTNFPLWTSYGNVAGAICTFNVTLGEPVPSVSPVHWSGTTGLPMSYFDPTTTATQGYVLLSGQTTKSENGVYYLNTTYGLTKIAVDPVNTLPDFVYVGSGNFTGSITTGASRAENGVYFKKQDGSYTKVLDIPDVLTNSSSITCPSGIVDDVTISSGSRVLFYDKTGINTVYVAPNATLTTYTHSPSGTRQLQITIPAFTVATDFDTEAENTNVFLKVTQGTYRKNTVWSRDSSAVLWANPTSAANISFLSNLVVTNNKIWGVTKMLSTSQPQYIVSFDLGTSNQNIAALPVRPSTAKAWMAPGYNGHVYVTNYNNFSVTKVNTDGTTVSSVIRLNSSPTRIFTDAGRRIWVSSYGGMLSLIDYDDDGVHNDWGTTDGIIAFGADPTDASKLWYVDATSKLVRLDITTKQVLETENASSDWGIVCKEFAALQDHGCLHVTPFVKYNKEDGTEVTVRPYVITRNYVSSTEAPTIAFRLDDTYFYRDAYCEVNGQGAVVDGTQEYFGE